jgi:phosphopantothenoylcysteine decarboxylase/phosphopantothenate--cysteine ligase
MTKSAAMKVHGDPLKAIKSSRGSQLKGKRIVLCVTGSVASIEVPALARQLMRRGAEVNVVMSEAAEKLVSVETMEWATGNPVVRRLSGRTEHVRLAGEWPGRADAVLIAPCTANTISKVALGIDDTPVTTFASMAMGGGIPLVICPAAHEPMYDNPAVKGNIRKLEESGAAFVGPKVEEGKAKMASIETIVEAVIRVLGKGTLQGKRVVVTGGPTVEFIDPVRVITNLSSGKTGLALAREAWRRGAEVSYVYGGSREPPGFLRSKRVVTTKEMLDAVLGELKEGGVDVFISAAAPADFAPASPSADKIPTRKGNLVLELKPTPKILQEVRRRHPQTYLVAFKAETTSSEEELERRARRYLKETGVDMVVANNVLNGMAFGTDSNSVTIVNGNRSVRLGPDLKEKLAVKILDEVSRGLKRRR